jgi:hypothetical protein
MSNLKENLSHAFEHQRKMDDLYPYRHRVIHKECCKHCPSKHGPDEETKDFMNAPKEYLAREVLFVCAWRESKLCKGLCDIYGIDPAYLDNLHSDKQPVLLNQCGQPGPDNKPGTEPKAP